jgi:hypothetical protein
MHDTGLDDGPWKHRGDGLGEALEPIDHRDQDYGCNVNSPAYKLLIVDELGYIPLSPTGAELLFEVFSQRYERGSIIVTSNLPFDEWTSVFASERLTGALLDRLTHHVHILEMQGDSYRLRQSKRRPRADAQPDAPNQD